MGGELRLDGGLTGGDDGELGGAVGGGDDAGVEVLEGVEVFDGGGLGEAEALSWTGGFGIGREGAMPVAPVKREVWKSGTELPMGVMQPRPVTTTRFTQLLPCDSNSSYKSQGRTVGRYEVVMAEWG